MNIFCTSECPIQSAIDLDDKRVIKMILESAQMLSTCVIMYRGRTVSGLYKPCFVNHPCTVWTRFSSANFNWLVTHALTLCEVYQLVYNKHHKTHSVIELASNYSGLFPSNGLTPFANATPYKEMTDIHAAYRRFMIYKWRNLDSRPPTWSRRNSPNWQQQ